MTDESPPGAACPLIVWAVPARNGAEIAKAALEGSCPSPHFFRDPESTRSPREPQRRRSGRGNAEIVDAACAWRPRHYFVGLLKAGQIDQGLLRFSYLAPDIVEAIVEGRQPRPLTIRLLFQGIPFFLVRPARHIRVHPLGSRKQAAESRADHS